MAEEAQVTPAPGAESSSTPPPPTTETASPGAVPPAEAKAPPPTRREQIAEAMAKKAEQGGDKDYRQKLIDKGLIKPASAARGAHAKDQPREQGRFAGPPAKKEESAPPAPAVAASPAPQVQRPSLPKWLKKELDPIWQQGSPELLDAVVKYGNDANAGIEKYKGAQAQLDGLMREFQPHQALIQAEGGNPQVVIRNLLQTAATLRNGTPYEKAMLTARIMQTYGVHPEHIVQLFNGQQPQIDQQHPQIHGHPLVQALMQRIGALESNWKSQQQSSQDAEARAMSTVIETWAKDKPNWSVLRPHVGEILRSEELGATDGMSETQILEAAYAKALEKFPALSAAEANRIREEAARQERDKATQQAQVARAAAVQVKGAPGSQSLPAIDPKDRRTAIKHAIALHSR